MKLHLSSLILVVVPGFAWASSDHAMLRQLQTSNSTVYWSIGDVNFTYTNGVATVNVQHAGFASGPNPSPPRAKFEVYGHSIGAGDWTTNVRANALSSCYSQNGVAILSPPFTDATNSPLFFATVAGGPYDSSWSFSFDKTVSNYSSIYDQTGPDGNTTAYLSFCVKFDMTASLDNVVKVDGVADTSNPTIVNYKEVAVVLQLTLDGTWKLVLDTTPLTPTVELASEYFNVTAYITSCTSRGARRLQGGQPIFNQSSVIPICVCPVSNLTYVKDFYHVDFTITNPDGTTTTQTAVDQRSVTNINLASYNCTNPGRADGCCEVDTSLIGAFYTPGLHQVTVNGIVDLQLGASGVSRLLGSSSSTGETGELINAQYDAEYAQRLLATTPQGTFSTTVQVVGNDTTVVSDKTSGASDWATAGGLMTATIATLSALLL